MATAMVTIHNPKGIHCRPAALIAREAKQHGDHRIRVIVEGKPEINAANPLGTMALGLFPGDQAIITVEGPNDTTVCHDIAALFEKVFDFH